MRLSLGQKISAGLGAALIILGIIGVVSYLGARQFMRVATEASRARTVIQAVDRTHAQLERALVEQRGYLITGDTGYLNRFRAAADSTDVALDALRNLTRRMPRQRARVDSAAALIASRLNLLRHTVVVRQEEGAGAAARAMVRSGALFLDEIRRLLDAVHETEQAQFATWSAETERRARMTTRVIAFGAVLAFVLAVVAAAAIVRDLRRQRHDQAMLRFLSEASQALASSLDVDTTLATMATLAVEQLADHALVDILRDDGRIDRTAVAAAHASDLPWLEVARGHPPEPTNEAHPVVQAIRTGHPVHVADFADAQERAIAGDAEHLAALRALGPVSAYTAPLVARGAILGALTFGRRGMRPWSARDSALAREVAARAALAVDNARLFRAAQRARAEAEAANRAKTEFLATMSHELRTPLNAIAGYTELLRLGIRGPIAPAQDDDLVRIRRNQEHLLAIINDILSFAKAEVGRVELTLAVLPLDEVLEDVADAIAPQARSRRVRYERGPGDAHLLVRADRGKLRQVLLNIVSNAVKFSPPGGIVTVSAHANGSGVVIAVRDTGPGIAPEHRERVFEPFVQLDHGLTRTTEGTGLGLAIARNFAREMGGEITLESVVGAGSTFSVRLGSALDEAA
jgi:signal transduction histidine kinase/CHASE3 domain sensor protein